MTINELREAIETYPQRLYKALEAVDKAEDTVTKLTDQIEEEEANLEPVAEAGEVSEQVDETTQETLIRLDHELSVLEVKCDQTKGRLELDYRRNPPEGDKVTEATVSAYVKSHPEFVEAKERCLDKKFEREKENVSRRAGYTASVAERRMARHDKPVTSPKLTKLQERLMVAQSMVTGAEMRVEEVRAGLASYQMLVQLYTAGLVK